MQGRGDSAATAVMIGQCVSMETQQAHTASYPGIGQSQDIISG